MTTTSQDGSWVATPLPRGRHGMDPDEVLASQRDRLLRAMEELVGERGYAATSVPEIVRRARVSPNVFYRCFGEKVDCIVALWDRHADQLMAEFTATLGAGETVVEELALLDRAIAFYLAWWTDRPRLARAYFVEFPLTDPRAMEQRDRTEARFAELHRAIGERARSLVPGLPPLRDEDIEASVILSTELVARQVRAGRVERVGELAGPLRRLMLKLLVGVEPPEPQA